MRRARALLLLVTLAGGAASASGCALLPCSPYSCSDQVCGCLPAGPLWATARARAVAPSSPPPVVRRAGEAMSY